MTANSNTSHFDWPIAGLDDEVAPVLVRLTAADIPFALATIIARDGGPRPVGSQMVIADGRWWGFLSGGCVEADVAAHASAALLDGLPRRLSYGRGSPFMDIRLPCGGRIDLLVEAVAPGDPAVEMVVRAMQERRPVRYLSDGVRRLCAPPGAQVVGAWLVDRVQVPAQRLVVVGHDFYALSIAAAGRHQGWEVTLVRPGGPPSPPPLEVGYRTDAPDAALAALGPDAWTAVAVATHDAELDQAGLLAALRSEAGYVGVLGSRRRLPERFARLKAAGLEEANLARLRAPIGLPIGAHSPRDVAVSVVAEIIAHRSGRGGAP